MNCAQKPKGMTWREWENKQRGLLTCGLFSCDPDTPVGTRVRSSVRYDYYVRERDGEKVLVAEPHDRMP